MESHADTPLLRSAHRNTASAPPQSVPEMYSDKCGQEQFPLAGEALVLPPLLTGHPWCRDLPGLLGLCGGAEEADPGEASAGSGQ